MNLEETPYMRLGGEDQVRQLVDRFFDLMDHLPEAWDIRKVHQTDLSSARNKLFKYLSGWLGGPPLYNTEFGNPNLKMSHSSFSIGTRERDQWILCMNQAMEDLNIQDDLRKHLDQAFFSTEDLIRNAS